MMMKMNKKYILEKLGIFDDIIYLFNKRGLVVPESISPVSNPLRSPSEEWFYSIADRYTPPLDEIEREVFNECPHLLVIKIYDSVNLLYDLSIILHKALDDIEKLNTEEKIVALLSLMYIFHGCLDNNYLKYDRHLEYLNYDISPVGYWWKKLKNILSNALKDKTIANFNEHLNNLMFKIIKAPRRLIITNEYHIICAKLYEEVRKYQNQDFNSDNVLQNIKEKNNKLYRKILEYSALFYTEPEKFVRDTLLIKGNRSKVDTLYRSKEDTIKAIQELKKLLPTEMKYELERAIEVIEDFIFIQELEGLMAYGKKKNCEYGIFDVLLRCFNMLKTLLNSHPEFINVQYRVHVINMLNNAQTVPEQFVADREIVVNLNKYFVNSITDAVMKEIRRWKNENLTYTTSNP